MHIGRASMVTIRPSMIGPAHPSYKAENVIIGVSGYARAGKDTIGDILVEKHGFTKFAFADKLRDVVYEFNPMVGIEGEPYEGGLTEIGVKDVIDRYGWDGYKETEYGPIIRTYLQRMGTEVGREMISDTIWVDELAKVSGRIVVTDMRFPNEYDKVKSLGGHVWRVERPNTKPANPHRSEIAIDDKEFDYILHNDAEVNDLARSVGFILDSYGITGTVL